MAKKSSTVNLESKFWDIIAKYQDDNNIDSRNEAIQYILHEWDILRKIDFSNINVTINGNVSSVDNIKTSTTDNEVHNENKPEEEKQQINPKIYNGIMSATSTMKKE